MSAPSQLTHGSVESVNVGTPRAVEVNGRSVLTSIWKHPVAGRVALRGVNLDGDDQADRTVHGGPDKAVYAYARADIEWWEAELGRSLGDAPFGENLTVADLPVSEAVIGEEWALGTALLQVAQPRLPCFKLGLRMGDPRFLKQFAAAGPYLASAGCSSPRWPLPSCQRSCGPGCGNAQRDRRPETGPSPSPSSG